MSSEQSPSILSAVRSYLRELDADGLRRVAKDERLPFTHPMRVRAWQELESRAKRGLL